MKIALLTNSLYPCGMGGMQKHSYYLARYLAQRQVQVDVYYFKSKTGKESAPENAFSAEELQYLTFYKHEFPSSVYFPGHYIYNSYRYSYNIYEELEKNLSGVDFIYVQGFSGLKLLKEKRAGKPLPPVGVNFHGLEMFQKVANIRSKLEQFLLRHPVRYCLGRADIAFSLGGKLTNILKKQAGDTVEVMEIPIGIEEKWLNNQPTPVSKPRKFIFIGRYERRKGIQELNKAIKNIYNEYEFYFEFIGPIPEDNQLNLPNCHYYGPIYDEDKIIDIVSGGDVLVCPSYSEGMPTVILEAMSRGLAVVATDVGAVCELVSPDTGWLIEPARIKQLTEALVDAITMQNPQLQQKKKAAIRLIGQKFTWNHVVDITIERIDKYIHEHESERVSEIKKV